MFKGFDLKINNEHYFNDEKLRIYSERGEALKSKFRAQVRLSLKSVLELDGDKLQSDWFPNISADVFLSHSHVDLEIAKKLAGFLKEEFGLTTFIDSFFWGHKDDLFKEIIEEDDDASSHLRAHIHNLLISALMNMIDNCEVLIFLNTDSAAPFCETAIEKRVYSPWIFSELNISRFIRIREPNRPISHRVKATLSAAQKTKSISYSLNNEHLIKIDQNTLVTWLKMWKSRNSYYSLTGRAEHKDYDHPLDKLYKLLSNG